MNFSLIVQRVKAGELIAKDTEKMIRFVATIDDAKTLRECKAQAAAVLAYLESKKDVSVEEHNAAVKIQTRVEHRLGEVLAANVKAGNPKLKCDTVSHLIPCELAVTDAARRKVSQRTQELARIPWEEIERRIDAKTETNEKAKKTRIIKELKQEQQREANAALVSGTKPLSEAVTDRFHTIVIDPPWDWGDEGDVSQFGRGKHEYAAMSFDELMALPVADRAADSCHLYLWITNRSLPKGFALMEQWGFRYVTCVTWCKPSIGMGNYFRGSTEHVLFGIRGSQQLLRADVGTWFQADRQGKHSTKPNEFYDLVERCSPGPWLEIFSRKERNGWVSWGAEVGIGDKS